MDNHWILNKYMTGMGYILGRDGHPDNMTGMLINI